MDNEVVRYIRNSSYATLTRSMAIVYAPAKHHLAGVTPSDDVFIDLHNMAASRLYVRQRRAAAINVRAWTFRAEN